MYNKHFSKNASNKEKMNFTNNLQYIIETQLIFINIY